MKQANRRMLAWAVGCVLSAAIGGTAFGEDWSQWRGSGRDARAAGFTAPATWPKQLAEKWKVAVGEGVATPAVVGDRVYVFSRQDNNEVIRCLEASSGKEIWSDKYEAMGAQGPAAQFSGPRASPAVGDGKVVTVGVRGMVSCMDAASGKKLWRKDEFGAWPQFFQASSPIIVDGMAICELGGKDNGAVVAYDLNSGEPKWKFAGDAPAYASPALMTVGDQRLVVAATAKRMVGLNPADGKLVWESPLQGQYVTSSPVVEGDVVMFASGNGMKAVRLAKAGDKVEGTELWSNGEKALKFNTPVVKDGLVYGVTQGNELFCLDAKTGKTAWAQSLGGGGGGGMGGRPGGPGGGGPGGPGAGGPPGGGAGGSGAGGPPGGGRAGRAGRGVMDRVAGVAGGGGGMGGGGGGGFASVVDAGSVLMALTPSSELVVFKPGAEKFEEVAKIKVAASPTHAYPVVVGNRVVVKDRDSVAALAVE